MTTRMLPPEEWPRLAGTEAETVWPLLDPAVAQVVVVEDGARIVGTWIVVPVVHVECCWIAEDYRKTGSVARRLLRGMREAVSLWGASSVMTGAVSDEVRALIAKLHGRLVPGEQYVIPLNGATPCQPS
jgi:hypothetical protein